MNGADDRVCERREVMVGRQLESWLSVSVVVADIAVSYVKFLSGSVLVAFNISFLSSTSSPSMI